MYQCGSLTTYATTIEAACARIPLFKAFGSILLPAEGCQRGQRSAWLLASFFQNLFEVYHQLTACVLEECFFLSPNVRLCWMPLLYAVPFGVFGVPFGYIVSLLLGGLLVSNTVQHNHRPTIGFACAIGESRGFKMLIALSWSRAFTYPLPFSLLGC